MSQNTYILGGGMTGLAAGVASGLPVFEAVKSPGGICSSYYLHPQDQTRLSQPPLDGEAYRFEIGGGHWIFGGDPVVLNFIRQLTPLHTYHRRSSVYFHKQNLYVPYPIQNNLRYLDSDIRVKALAEMSQWKQYPHTMKDWLEKNFGTTLSELFFYPFHELYTAGLYKKIAPQDAYKSPVNLPAVIQGAFETVPAVGYNVSFVYPTSGLNTLAQAMAAHCDIRYGKQAVKIDVENKQLYFANGESVSYDSLISTLPLNKMMEITELSVEDQPDPYTSVLVLNIGAVRGSNCPNDHWLYNFNTESGFHRVGFYSNVDPSFLPKSAQEKHNRVSIYVERSYPGGCKPSPDEINRYAQAVIKELQYWQFIQEVEVADPTWIDVAYTWSFPHSNWKKQALNELESYDIYAVGRYGRWVFQGIADSIRDGLFVGAAFQPKSSY